MIDWSDYSPIFKPHEFACRCGCGKVEMQKEFLDILYDLRKDLDTSFTITSGYRCPVREKSEGGSGSNHPKGLAADIVADRSALSKIASRAEAYGFTGIGVSLHGEKKFIHLDTSHQYITVWSY